MNRIQEALSFGKEGKLESIHLSGCPNFLMEYAYAIDMQGKFYRPAGWDECFPTIDPYQDYPVMGDLVGLEPDYGFEDGSVRQTWSTPAWSAQRTFRLVDPAHLEVQFRATNRGSEPARFLWASHALFRVQDLHSIAISSLERITDFSRSGCESKTFYPNTQPVRLEYAGFKVELASDQPYWGVWLNLGGWPEDAIQPIYCVGIEPTNTSGEIPGQQFLAPGETFAGGITVQVCE